MKWIKVSDGKYELVADNDPRPEDKEFASRKGEIGPGFSTTLKPPWLIEADTHKLANDPEASSAYTEAMQVGRATHTSSGYWKKWESERKAAAMANKAEWIKRGARPEEREEAING